MTRTLHVAKDGELPAADPIALPGRKQPVVFIDGACNLCNHAVQFVLDNEDDGTQEKLSFVSLQSDVARAMLVRAFGEAEAETIVRGASGSGDPDSVVVIDGERALTHSDAALHVIRHLRMPYRWLAAFGFLPRGLRDAVYRVIARNRYRFFGRSEICRVPTPSLRGRFLDARTTNAPERDRLAG